MIVSPIELPWCACDALAAANAEAGGNGPIIDTVAQAAVGRPSCRIVENQPGRGGLKKDRGAQIHLGPPESQGSGGAVP